MPEAVGVLERDLRGVFGTRLQSLIIYGQHARAHAHGAAGRDASHGHASHDLPRIHTLAIVEALTADDLRACAPRVTAWHDAGLGTPLIVAAHEFERSLDAFPFEFGAILSDHTIVTGSSPFEGLTVDPQDLRRACEVQARGHLLHLREGYLETRGNGDALAILVVKSSAPFAALVESVARLDGAATGGAEAAARHVDRSLGLAGPTATDVVALVGVSEMSANAAERLFPPYLEAAERLVSYIDRWRSL